MTTATATRAPVGREVCCRRCRGLVSRDGQPIHDHHPSCTYWSLRCRICQTPIQDHAVVPPHEVHEELCFLCGDLLEVESHP